MCGARGQRLVYVVCPAVKVPWGSSFLVRGIGNVIRGGEDCYDGNRE